MKKKNNKAQDEKLKKLQEEWAFIKEQIEAHFNSAEGIGVDAEHKEVSFMIDNSEYQSKKSSWSSDKVNFKLDYHDDNLMSLRFIYKVK